MNQFVKNGKAKFGRNIPTEISGPPLEVDLEYNVFRLRETHFSGIVSIM